VSYHQNAATISSKLKADQSFWQLENNVGICLPDHSHIARVEAPHGHFATTANSQVALISSVYCISLYFSISLVVFFLLQNHL